MIYWEQIFIIELMDVLLVCKHVEILDVFRTEKRKTRKMFEIFLMDSRDFGQYGPNLTNN